MNLLFHGSWFMVHVSWFMVHCIISCQCCDVKPCDVKPYGCGAYA